MRTSEINNFLNETFNLKRSLSGKDNFKTLAIIKEKIPILIKSFQSGKKVFDWKIPKIWTLNDAYIKDSNDIRIVDVKKNFLHVASHSIKVNKKISWPLLKKNIFYSRHMIYERN